MYSIGDKIVYPMHGAGVIEAIEVKKILKEKQSYYIMRIPIGNMLLMIPTLHTDDIGIRSVIDLETASDVIRSFSLLPSDHNDNWNKRYRENMIKIRTGDIYEVLDVVKSLMLLDLQRGLSTGERKMLSNAKNILLSELVLACRLEYRALEKQLEDAVHSLNVG